MSSPTQRSLAELRKRGYVAEVTEKWIAPIHKRKDLYGFIDILAIKPGEVVSVQACSGCDVSERTEQEIEQGVETVLWNRIRHEREAA